MAKFFPVAHDEFETCDSFNRAAFIRDDRRVLMGVQPAQPYLTTKEKNTTVYVMPELQNLAVIILANLQKETEKLALFGKGLGIRSG